MCAPSHANPTGKPRPQPIYNQFHPSLQEGYLLDLRFFATTASIKGMKLLFFIPRIRLSPVTWKRTEVKCESLIIIGALDFTPFPLTISAPPYCLLCNSDGQ